MRQWGTATGIGLSNLSHDLEDDLRLRKQIKSWKDKLEEEGVGTSDLGGMGGGESDFGGPSDLGGDLDSLDSEEGIGPSEEGPVMEKVPTPENSVVDSIPPPPQSSYRRFRVSDLKGHPLLKGSRFGGVSIENVNALNGKTQTSINSFLVEASLNSHEKAWIKYAASYSGLRFELTRSEVQIIAKELNRHKVFKKSENFIHLSRLNSLAPEASLSLLSGR
jgi:hypothetical protein